MDLSYTRTIQEKLDETRTSKNGLSYAEARKRLEIDGKNVLASQKKRSPFVKFLMQFKDILICVLIVSAIISLVIGFVENSVSDFVDAGIIFAVVIFNAVFGFLQERKSEQAMEALKNMTKPFCKVVRNGRSMKLKSEELVVGDIVLLEAGDIVPADLRLIESSSLKIDESSLTGESLPIEKDAEVVVGSGVPLAERVNMAYMGSVVTYGHGSGVVCATGMETEMGKIASELTQMDNTQTPLTKRIKRTSVILTIVVLVVCAVIFAVEIIEGENWFSAFSVAVAIAVCTVPEGLPACNTITMSAGIKRMSEQRAIVKSLPAVETLGSTEVICSDKTGTLTLNKMTVRKVFFFGDNCKAVNDIKFSENAIEISKEKAGAAGGANASTGATGKTAASAGGKENLDAKSKQNENLFASETLAASANSADSSNSVNSANSIANAATIGGEFATSAVATLDEVQQQNEFMSDKNFVSLLHCMLLCNDTKVQFVDEKLETIGDPTEVALVSYGYKLGFNKQRLEGEYLRKSEVPFDSDRKLMSTIHSFGKEYAMMTKGAVDSILSRCNRVLDNGKIRRLTSEDKQRILDENAGFASGALRNLAFAVKRMDSLPKKPNESIEQDLVFLGLVGMIDPPREEVKEAIKTCKQAGITTIMITGDHRDTAFAIAKELGICTSEEEVITGVELDNFSDEKFAKIVENYRVYARVSPSHKVRIVKALKAAGKVVAMTGDGVNDAPSIKAADIGVGMGITGTDVTKEAADIILTDDNFATIVGAVKEGRRIYNTILKILMFLLGTGVAELISLTVATLVFGADALFTPVLILWINFVSDTFVGLALAYEKPDPDIMKKKPIKNSGSLFKGNVGVNIMCSALFVAAGILGMYSVLTYAFGYSHEVVSTMCFLYLCFSELFHAYNLKSEKRSLFSKNPFDNKVLNISFSASALLTMIVVLVPLGSFQSALGITTLSIAQWAVSVGLALLIIPFFELVKWIGRTVDRRKGNNKNKNKNAKKVET